MTTATLTRLASVPRAHQEYASDRTIMQACVSGTSEWALEQLYEQYRPFIYGLAYRILRDSYLAEDVVQDVFFTLWRKASVYQQELGSVKSWLQTIARNRAIDKVRALTHREYSFAQLQDLDEQDFSISEVGVWEQVWADEQAASLRQALAQLPAEQRQVIELNYFSGYAHAEIAARLRLPIGTVKGRIRLGLQKIKHLLQKNDTIPAGHALS